MIRLRQLALVADDLDATVDAICRRFALQVCVRDLGVEEFGLHNALMTIGDQFLEVVSPFRPGTTAGRLLDKRCGPTVGGRVCGYMVIHEVDDLDARLDRVTGAGVRVVFAADLPAIRCRHLHPADVGGAIVSIDQPVPNGIWPWAGPDWAASTTAGHRDVDVVTAIAGAAIAARDVPAMRGRWQELGVAHGVRFVPAGDTGEGLDVVELVATDRDAAGASFVVGNVELRLV